MYKNLRALRESLNMTQEQFGKSLGLAKTTYSNYENGDRQPNSDFWISVAKTYGVTIDYLMGFSSDPTLTSEQNKKAAPISGAALKLARAYDNLDEHGKRIVDYIIQEELSRVESKDKIERSDPDNEVAMLDMIVYTDPSAAGIPLYAENDYERIEFPASEVPRGADFGVRISGDSMEPTIHGGTIVWVHKVPELREGQIGIFMVDGGAVCKRFYNTGSGIELRSDNSKYDPIKVSEFERLGIVGRVLGYK